MYKDKYFYYSYVNVYVNVYNSMATNPVISYRNAICCHNHPIIVANAQSVNGDERIVNSWKEITKEEYKLFMEYVNN